MDGRMTLILFLPGLERWLTGVRPPSPKPRGVCLIYIGRAGRQKCHHLGHRRKGLAEKIKGIFYEMLICFWKLLGIAATGASGLLRWR